MGLESFKRYQDLCKRNYFPQRIGFGPKPNGDKVVGGDINRLNARVRLAEDFRAISLDGYSEDATLGYSGYLQVFLTHSALERFMEIYGIKHISGLSDQLELYAPEKAVTEFFAVDKGDKLHTFLCERVHKKLEESLSRCKLGESANVAYISAAIRHIFAHGHLTANANGINPKNVNKACMLVSTFLLRFMDAEFTNKIDACYDRIADKELTGRFVLNNVQTVEKIFTGRIMQITDHHWGYPWDGILDDLEQLEAGKPYCTGILANEPISRCREQTRYEEEMLSWHLPL